MPTEAQSSWLNQRIWRMIGGAALGGCAVLALFGHRAVGPETPLWFRAGYWGGFVLMLAIALYMAVLDLRFIRLQYLLARREIFRETLGETSFRSTLREIEERERNERRESGPPGS